jgi:hypothetical protein
MTDVRTVKRYLVAMNRTAYEGGLYTSVTLAADYDALLRQAHQLHRALDALTTYVKEMRVPQNMPSAALQIFKFTPVIAGADEALALSLPPMPAATQGEPQ